MFSLSSIEVSLVVTVGSVSAVSSPNLLRREVEFIFV
jgi:hypothetical protein